MEPPVFICVTSAQCTARVPACPRVRRGPLVPAVRRLCDALAERRNTGVACLGSHNTSAPSSDTVTMCLPGQAGPAASRMTRTASARARCAPHCTTARAPRVCSRREQTVWGELAARDGRRMARVDVHERALGAPQPRGAVPAASEHQVALGMPCDPLTHGQPPARERDERTRGARGGSVSSRDPEERARRGGVGGGHRTMTSLGPSRAAESAPVSTSQTLTRPSMPPTATSFPSRLKATAAIESVWPAVGGIREARAVGWSIAVASQPRCPGGLGCMCRSRSTNLQARAKWHRWRGATAAHGRRHRR